MILSSINLYISQLRSQLLKPLGLVLPDCALSKAARTVPKLLFIEDLIEFIYCLKVIVIEYPTTADALHDRLCPIKKSPDVF